MAHNLAPRPRRLQPQLVAAALAFSLILLAPVSSEAEDVAAAACHDAPAPLVAGQPTRRWQLIENEDATNFFFYHDILPGQAGAAIDRYVDALADAGVNVLLCNTNDRRTNYRSAVWQSYWDGFDPAGPDDQPFLAPIPKDQVARYRHLVAGMLEVDRQGIDYPARMIARSRTRGISPWITLRMNDVHYNDNLDHPFHSPFWRKPELFRQGTTDYFARALDYAHPEVREHYRALLVETLERYDIDGLELDFVREPYLFSVGHEAEGRPLLTAWLRDVRRLVDDAARRRGHAIKLGVRVPSCPQVALGLGLDAPTWAHERLVDVVVATPRWATLQFDMPLAKWRELLGDRVTLAGGLEVICRPSHNVPPRPATPAEATGAAVAVLAAGADALYLFNYFQDGSPGWSAADYRRTLKAFASPQTLLEQPRRHAITYRDILAPGEAYHAPLPATGKEFVFELPLGPPPPAGWQVEAVIETQSAAHVIPPAVRLNGLAGELRSDETLPNCQQRFTYSLPLAALTGQNRQTIALHADTDLTLVAVEIGLKPGD
ncbi:MAG TPA: hypothetical protein VMF30_11915 [Pirellulales bacterium]|nr:hypothetical protein [Pirellulales bacterium]